jgi:hypothetical protein
VRSNIGDSSFKMRLEEEIETMEIQTGITADHSWIR